MVSLLSNIITAFVLGLLTPLTAVCVLPLYPGFLAYLSKQVSSKESEKKNIALLGIIVSIGVITFMLLLGLLFTRLLQISLTKVIGIVSPIALGVLSVISLFLIFDIDIGKFFPQMHTPLTKSPYSNAFLFGFFFGAVVVPCNPLFIAALFAQTASNIAFIGNLLSFLFFGIGIAFPLLLFSIISAAASTKIISFLTEKKVIINRIAGVIMLIISLYYLLFVFKIFGG